MNKSIFLGFFAVMFGMRSLAFASDGLDGKVTLVGHVVESTCPVDMTLGKLRHDCQNAAQRFMAANPESKLPGITTTRIALSNDAQRQIILNTYD
ncbi:TPA: DUF2574 family protein [Citrobacter sedlakii]|nr:DUF2574 family protein [Citrobacter sedlakii]